MGGGSLPVRLGDDGSLLSSGVMPPQRQPSAIRQLSAKAGSLQPLCLLSAPPKAKEK